MPEQTAPIPFPVLVLAACTLTGCGESNEAKRPGNVVAEVSEHVSTVVNVSWTTEEASIGYVQYGLTEEMDRNTPLEAEKTKEHALSLLGLTADTDYFFRVVTYDGDDAAASDVASVHTGNLPAGMPALSRKGDGHDQFTLTSLLGQRRFVTIINPEGKIVWYHSEDRDLDFYRVRLSVDGKSLLYNAASVSGDPADNSEIVRISLDGSKTSAVKVPLLAHDFVEHPDGTLAAIVVEYRDVDGTEIKGDKIVEVDEDGEETTVWSAWDCFDPVEHPGENMLQGWTFANALDYDPDEEAYYISMRNFSSIAKIDRNSGECEWVLGATASTLEFASGSARFLHEHQFQVLGDHLLVMDNDGSPGTESRVLEYELDFDNNVATEVWSYISDPSVYTFVLGEPVRLANGDTFINWSAAGQMEYVTKDGDSVWKLNTPAGFVFGFHTMEKSLYGANAVQP